MLNLAALFGWCVLGVAVLIAAHYLVVIMTLRRLRFTPAVAGERIVMDAIPADEHRLLALAAPRLSALGFTAQHAWRTPYVLVSDPPRPQYSTAWLHEPSGAWAVVALCEQPEHNALYTVSFHTFYVSGPHLYTVARRAHELIIVHPSMVMLDSGADLEHQWQAHLDRMQTRDDHEVLREVTSIVSLERRLPAEMRAAGLAAGLLEAAEDDTARFSWRGAWRSLRRYSQGIKALRSRPLPVLSANGLALTEPSAPEIRACADHVAISNALAAQRHDPGRRHKSALLLVTGMISLLVFGWQFGWLFSVVLVGVLLFHELGHLVAMRWAGYRDLQVFFCALVWRGNNRSRNPGSSVEKNAGNAGRPAARCHARLCVDLRTRRAAIAAARVARDT